MARARAIAAALIGLSALACLTSPAPSEVPAREPARVVVIPALEHPRLDPGEVRIQPEGLTVEQNWFLDLYTLFHARDYRVMRIVYPSAGRGDAIAHLSLPARPGRLPAVVVFPILGGSHVISELLSKVLVRRGFAVARLERRPLDLEAAPDVATVVERMRATILDGRRLVDWLEQHPRVDPQRIAAAGASLGGMQATCLAAVDGRVSGLILMLSGGGLPELLYDSAERPVQTFRDRILLKRGLDLEDRSGFVAAVEPQTRVVDPLTCAPAIPTASVYLATGRFDRVMPTSRSLALWEALRRPIWRKMPAGHYQAFPFLFGAVGRGVRLIETWWDQR